VGPVLPSAEQAAGLAERVQAGLAALDAKDLTAHPDAFEALGAAILAELRSLEGL
jgi:hypothetical protein